MAVIHFVKAQHWTQIVELPDAKDRESRVESKPVYHAFVLRPGEGDAKAAWIELGEASPIDEALIAWRAAIEGQRRPAENADAETARRLLREKLWLPVEKRLQGCAAVAIIPDDALAALPWPALPGRKPQSFLLEDYALSQASYGQQLVELLRREESHAKGMVVVGDIAYDQRPQAKSSPDAATRPGPSRTRSLADARPERGWTPLPGAGQEARQIARIYSQHRASDATLMTGRSASEAALASASRNARFIHLATHGFFAAPSEAEKVFVSDPRRLRLFEGESLLGGATLAARNPLLLSGLALTGANLGPEKDSLNLPTGDDGILTAEEVEGLDLRHVELVTLSACETGLGEIGLGEGVFGVQRAFHQAGARAVVASLWKVDDHATQALMAEFYRNLWERNLSKREALRQAQLEMARSYNPRTRKIERGLGASQPLAPGGSPQAFSEGFWAAFVLSGDWR